MEQRWDAAPTSGLRTIPIGDALAILYIPRLGKDYPLAIVEGSTCPTRTSWRRARRTTATPQLPGKVGNFAVAGHRVGKGEPFLNLDRLKAGDPVIVADRAGLVRLPDDGPPPGSDPPDTPTPTADAGRTCPREIVQPGNGDVLLPCPTIPAGAPPPSALMTMTTCHPKFTAENRMIVYAKLDTTAPGRQAPRPDSHMPPSIQALYSEVGG